MMVSVNIEQPRMGCHPQNTGTSNFHHLSWCPHARTDRQVELSGYMYEKRENFYWF